MLSLETIGYYSDAPGSQRYPPPLGLFYPGRADFIAFVGALLMLALPRRLVEGAAVLPRDGSWPGWSPTWMLGRRLRGKTLGIVGMGRIGTAEECAEAIVWLLSPEASYTTMSLVEVSGGR